MSKDYRDLSVLLVGCGSIGQRHARILTKMGVHDIRVCDPDAKQVERLIQASQNVRVVSSFEQGLMEKPSVVFVLTPPKMHLTMATQAILAGCDVFCEKPLSDTLEGVAEFSAIVQKTGRRVMVGLCFRYHQGLLRAKELVDAGKIGRLVSIRALMGEHLPDVRPDYKTLFSAKYSGAFDLMHDVDLAIWYAGQDIDRVSCLYGTFSDIGIEAPDIVEILMGFKDRCIATVHLDFFQRPRRRQMELIGIAGVIIVEFASWDHCTVSIYDGCWTHEKIETVRDDMFEAEDREFLESVSQNKPIKCTIHEAVKSIRVVAEAQKSAFKFPWSGDIQTCDS